MHQEDTNGIELRRGTTGNLMTCTRAEDGRFRFATASQSGAGASITLGRSDTAALYDWLRQQLTEGPDGPWWDRPVKDLLTELDALRGAPDALIAAAEGWTEQAKRMATFSEAAKVLANRAAALALANMSEGEAVEAPSGRWAYVGKVRDGKASIRPEAFDEHADDLPPGYEPKQVTKYPTVTQLRAAVKRGEITRELYRELVDSPPLVLGLRWRTLTDDVEGDEL